jgi:hypothetical protein
MNKIRNYWRNKKGITLVWGAFFLILCLMFLGLSVDIAYMYVVKNQLQVAADAAALAGAANLTGELDEKNSSYEQMSARQEAWKFACKNKAAGDPVFLVSQDTNCDNPPNNKNALNGDDNSGTEDIVVGHWSYTCPLGFTCVVGQPCEPTGSGYFCRADGNTDLSINAIRVVPRRTGETPGMPRARLFIGKVFGWSAMNARASAIAMLESNMGPLPLCQKICDPPTETPLTVVTTADEQNVTPGRRFILNPPSTTWPYVMTWTSFLEGPTSTTNVNEYINGKIIPPICNQCINTTQGALADSECEMRKKWFKSKTDHTVNGTPINGWKIKIPILQNIASCPSGSACIDDPGLQPGPYFVNQYTDVIVTDVITRGSCGGSEVPDSTADKNKPWSGVVLVGTGPGPSGYSTIQCTDCNDPSVKKQLYTLKLVK